MFILFLWNKIQNSDKLNFDRIRANTPTDGELTNEGFYMWAFIGAVSLVASIVLLIIGIIGKIKKKAILKRSFLISLGAFILFIVAIIATPKPEVNAVAESTPEPTKVVATDIPSTPAPTPVIKEVKKIEDPAEFTKSVVLKNFDSADVTFNDGWLEITAAGKDNITEGLMKVGFKSGIADTLKELKDRPEVKDVNFKITLPMVDKFGKESIQVVVAATFLKATRDKIVWDNFSYDNIPDIADSYGGQFSK